MQTYEQIIQKTWEDSAFKSQLMANPKSVLAEMGQSIPEDVTVEVHDDSENLMHFVLLEKDQLAATNFDADPIVGKIMMHAHEDSAFKQRLLQNSKAAIQEVLGVEPPQNIKVLENTPNHLHLVLPNNPNATGELSDNDLAMVAGGKGITLNCQTVGGFLGKAGGLSEVVGETLPGNFGGLFTSLGPLLTGGGNMLTKVSSFFGGSAE